MEYEVEFVELDNNKKPFKEFVIKLPIKERARIFETINYFIELKNNNLPVKTNLSKYIEDGIFELRTSIHDKIARTLYFYQIGARVIITHGFIKKSRKTPRKEIQKAKDLREIYIKRFKHD